MKEKRKAWLVAFVGGGAAMGALASGCETGTSPPNRNDTASSYENLTTDLSICQKSQETCLDAADGNSAMIQTCHDELLACREAAITATQELHAALRACVDAAKACVAGDGGQADSGMPLLLTCGIAFHECVEAALPPPPPLPPCAAALKECLQGDGGQVDAGTCLAEYRACAIAELPPCAQEFATCIEQGGEFWTCATAARECWTYRMTHDGGVPPTL